MNELSMSRSVARGVAAARGWRGAEQALVQHFANRTHPFPEYSQAVIEGFRRWGTLEKRETVKRYLVGKSEGNNPFMEFSKRGRIIEFTFGESDRRVIGEFYKWLCEADDIFSKK